MGGPFNNFVDVRDVARIHIRALEKGDVSDGQRFLCSSGAFTWQMVVDILRRRFPERKDKIVEGETGKNYEVETSVSTKKASNLLGATYDISLEECLVDTCNSLKEFW